MKLKQNKIKSLSFFAITCLISTTTITFISTFFSNKNNENLSDQINGESENLESIKISLENEISNEKYNKLISFSGDKEIWYFDIEKIKKNIINIIKESLNNNSYFKNNINNYKIICKFSISENKNKVIFNIFIYNKNNSSKKYHSFFALNII